MVKHFLFISGLLFSMSAFAQTGIGTTTPHTSAKLDVSATNKGFLPPRVSLTDAYDRTTISNPANGLLVYCKGDAGLSAGYYFWNGSAWATIATEGGSGSVAAEYGTQFLANATSITVNASTSSSSGAVTVFSFNLPSIGTWEIITFLRGFVPSASSAIEFGVFDPSGSLVPNSEVLVQYGTLQSTATNAVQITNSTIGTYTIKAWSNSTGGGITSDNNGKSGVSWKKISGNAPVTGQSVDYGIARFTGADTGPMSALALVSFDATAAGNLAWSGNKFTLKANKTYELESSLAIYQTSGGTAGRFQIYDYTNSISLANGLFISMNGSGTNSPSGNAPMKCIITPNTDIQVGIRLLDFYGAAAPGIVGSTFYAGSSSSSNASYFIVKQIGSSAIVNPWVLSGNDVYNTTGNVGIGTNSPTAKLNLSGGGLKINSGLGNSSNRPSLNTATIGNYEIRGVGGGGTQNDTQDDGFLRLSAGGGTNTSTQSSIDLSGYSATIPDMNRNIVMRTAGVERFRIDASGNLNVPDINGNTSNILTKVARYANTEVYLQLDNLKVACTRNGAGGGWAGLSVGAVSGTFNASISGTYGISGGVGGKSNYSVSYGTTGSDSIFGWGFGAAGDGATYIINDLTNLRVYRVVLLVGYGFSNNFISIEKLY